MRNVRLVVRLFLEDAQKALHGLPADRLDATLNFGPALAKCPPGVRVRDEDVFSRVARALVREGYKVRWAVAQPRRVYVQWGVRAKGASEIDEVGSASSVQEFGGLTPLSRSPPSSPRWDAPVAPVDDFSLDAGRSERLDKLREMMKNKKKFDF